MPGNHESVAFVVSISGRLLRKKIRSGESTDSTRFGRTSEGDKRDALEGREMMIVDIEVPSLERKYQFSLEEQVAVETLIAELAEVLCQKEQCDLKGEAEALCLCSKEQQRILDRYATLAQQGIRNADELLLV